MGYLTINQLKGIGAFGGASDDDKTTYTQRVLNVEALAAQAQNTKDPAAARGAIEMAGALRTELVAQTPWDAPGAFSFWSSYDGSQNLIRRLEAARIQAGQVTGQVSIDATNQPNSTMVGLIDYAKTVSDPFALVQTDAAFYGDLANQGLRKGEKVLGDIWGSIKGQASAAMDQGKSALLIAGLAGAAIFIAASYAKGRGSRGS